MQWPAGLIAAAQDCHKRGKQVTCKRARQTREEKDKNRRRVNVDKINSVYLTDSHVWWVENLNSTATKKVTVPSSLFVFSFARLPRSLAPSHVFYPRPRDYFEAPACQEVGYFTDNAPFLLSPYTGSFQAFSVNAFQWCIRNERTTWPETHRPRTIMRPSRQATLKDSNCKSQTNHLHSSVTRCLISSFVSVSGITLLLRIWSRAL